MKKRPFKILFIENARGSCPPWYFDRIDVPEGTMIDFYNIPEVDFLESLPYLFKGWMKSLGYEVIVTRQCLYSVLIYSLFFKVFSIKNRRLVIDGFQTNEPERTLRGYLKRAFLKFVLSSPSLITCYSKYEIEYYSKEFSLRKEKLAFIPLGLNFVHREKDHVTEDYIISAGRTGRDFETFLNAVSGLQIKTVVVTSPKNLEGLTIPENVDVKFDIPLSELNELIAGAKICITPLKNKEISVGQRVCLQYMAMGKAQIATNIPAVNDYLIHNVTGLLVPLQDENSMKESILKLWNDTDLLKRMGISAKARVRDAHTLEKFYLKFFALIEQNCT